MTIGPAVSPSQPQMAMHIDLHPSISIRSPVHRGTPADASSQTELTVFKNQATDPIVQPSKSVQTDKTEARMLSARQVRIDQSVVELMLAELQAVVEQEELFNELDDYHRNRPVKLNEFRRVELKLVEDLPVSTLKCSRDRRVCVLFGESRHDSWCLHSGGVLVWDRTKQYWISLDSCATHLEFAPQRQIIVGTASGSINVLDGEEVVWRSERMHLQAITSLTWLSGKLLLSTGLDGRLVVSSVQPVGLEPLKSGALSVSDLPRSMRRSNSSAVKVAAVACTLGSHGSVFVATETGAILQVEPDGLSATATGYDRDGIDNLEWIDDKFLVISGADSEVKLLSRSGQTLEWLGCRAWNGQYCRNGKLFMFVDEGVVNGFDMETGIRVVHDEVELKSIDFTSDGDLVGITDQMELVWFELQVKS